MKHFQISVFYSSLIVYILLFCSQKDLTSTLISNYTLLKLRQIELRLLIRIVLYFILFFY